MVKALTMAGNTSGDSGRIGRCRAFLDNANRLAVGLKCEGRL